MEERDVVILLSLVMIAIAALFAYYYNGFSLTTAFNFNNASLTLNGRTVVETLYFVPDQPYHTLFRTLGSQIASSGNNTVTIQSVNCSAGTPYYRTYAGTCQTFLLNGSVSDDCMPNTENNEYGCTFGDVRGFSSGENYSMTAQYVLNPANLFLINGTYYIKFVAYSAGDHYNLRTNTNLFVKGGIADAEYLSNKDVVIYIPYEGSIQGFNIITQKGFGFGNSNALAAKLYNFFLLLIPLILFDGIWLYFAQQKREPPAPSQLSDVPNDRKPWEVNAYFTPPFISIGKNFYATLMLDFYRRKIIDIKQVDEGIFNHKTFVRISQGDDGLDDVEKKFLAFLKDIGESVGDKDRDGEYFDVNKAGSKFLSRFQLSQDARELSAMVSKGGSNFIDVKCYYLFFGLLVGALFVVTFVLDALTVPIIFSFILMFVVGLAVNRKTPLLVKYKQDFYEEYEQWMAFKHGLSHLSIKNAESNAIVLWEKYLVYATALGVADKVLEQFKALNMIDKERLNTYSSAYIASSAFSRAMTTSGGGGGGVGGGGVGGGGGGGR